MSYIFTPIMSYVFDKYNYGLGKLKQGGLAIKN